MAKAKKKATVKKSDTLQDRMNRIIEGIDRLNEMVTEHKKRALQIRNLRVIK